MRTWTGFTAAALVVVAAGGCKDPNDRGALTHDVSFVGYVYDVLTGARLGPDNYSITLEAGTRETEGEIREDGRYAVGPISVADDFTIVLEAEGYRAFRSHNARRDVLPSATNDDRFLDVDIDRTLHYDAYVFPEGLVSPELTFEVRKADDPALTDAAGTLRMVPASPSQLEDDNAETPEGIGGQSWVNDEDLQSPRVLQDFTDGSVVIPEGALLFGVSYARAIYNVTGYAFFQDFFGIDTGNRRVTLSPQAGLPLEVTGISPPDTAATDANATVTITFNQPVEFSDVTAAETAIDQAFFIQITDGGTPNTDPTVTPRTLPVGDNGTSAVASGSTVTLTWDESVTVGDPDDDVDTVTYGFGTAQVQPAGRPNDAASIAGLILDLEGATSITRDFP